VLTLLGASRELWDAFKAWNERFNLCMSAASSLQDGGSLGQQEAAAAAARSGALKREAAAPVQAATAAAAAAADVAAAAASASAEEAPQSTGLFLGDLATAAAPTTQAPTTAAATAAAAAALPPSDELNDVSMLVEGALRGVRGGGFARRQPPQQQSLPLSPIDLAGSSMGAFRMTHN
jgi:hypothetical protein